MGWEGIATLIGKLADYIPGRKESLRNQIDKTKRKMDEIQKRKPFRNRDALEYAKYSKRLRDLERKATNN